MFWRMVDATRAVSCGASSSVRPPAIPTTETSASLLSSLRTRDSVCQNTLRWISLRTGAWRLQTLSREEAVSHLVLVFGFRV